MRLGYSASTALLTDPDEAFRFAQTLRLDFIELAWELCELQPTAYRVARILELKRRSALSVSLHLPFIDLNLASPIPIARRAALMRIRRALDYGASIGAECAVLHTGQNNFFHADAEQRARDALDASLAALKPSPLPIVLENNALCAQDLIRGPAALAKLCDRSGFAACLDLGHAHIEGQHGLGAQASSSQSLIERYIATLQGRIFHLHLHDNDGVHDHHHMLGQGTLPLERYATFLRSFSGALCLEVAGGKDPVKRSVERLRQLVKDVTHA